MATAATTTTASAQGDRVTTVQVAVKRAATAAAETAAVADTSAAEFAQPFLTPRAAYTSSLKATLRGSALALVASKRFMTYA